MGGESKSASFTPPASPDSYMRRLRPLHPRSIPDILPAISTASVVKPIMHLPRAEIPYVRNVPFHLIVHSNLFSFLFLPFPHRRSCTSAHLFRLAGQQTLVHHSPRVTSTRSTPDPLQ